MAWDHLKLFMDYIQAHAVDTEMIAAALDKYTDEHGGSDVMMEEVRHASSPQKQIKSMLEYLPTDDEVWEVLQRARFEEV